MAHADDKANAGGALADALAERVREPLTHAQRAGLVALIVALILYPHVLDQPYQRHVLVMIFIYGLMAQGWNVLAGYCGQISLGQAVFFGIGAYSAAFLYAEWQITPWLGMLVGVAIAIVVALLIGLPTFRLRGHYFAIATLVIGEIAQTLFINWEFVGGATGVWVPIERESPWLTLQFHENKLPNYYLGLAFLAAACAFVAWMERSKLGLYFRAIRDDPDAARSLGVDITRYKLIAITISAAFTAIAGAQFAQYVLVIDPETVFPLLLSILVVLMTMLGGIGTLWGPIIGASVLFPLSEFTRVWFGGTGGAEDLMIYGALIVVISVAYPGGLITLLRRVLAR
ncbi:MAG: branched-chain amino acid ABC transporter permease [Gammaproteobacteria bacterium]|nr:branched-chain amino acid ABC transporter permease [Gammaproteobacteria bacterium]